MSACVPTDFPSYCTSSNATILLPAMALPSNTNVRSTEPSALSGVNVFVAVTS